MDKLSPEREPLKTTERLVELALGTQEGDIPEEAYSIAKRSVLDGVANMLAGSREELGKLTAQLAKDMGSSTGATVIGTDIKTSPAYAAFANAAAAHSLDYENMWYPPTHPTSPVLPGLLALSETRCTLSGKAALAAMVVSYEAQGRMNLAIQGTENNGFRFHPPSTIGMVGAALACSRALGLDVYTTQMAVGISADRAGGLLCSTGSMTKSQHSAHAARSGVEAALLAQAGYTSNPWVIEADTGMADAVWGPGFDFEAVTKDFGNPYRMVNPGLATKLFPTQYTTHPPITAALEVASQPGFSAQAVRRVEVHCGYPNWSAPRPFPPTGLAGRFSIPYTVAAALLDGEVVIDSFTDERRFRPDMEEMLKKITVIEDPAIPRGLDFANTWSWLTVELVDGQSFTAECRIPPGRWDRPATLERHLEKFRDCAKRALSPARMQEVEDQILHFEEVQDVGKFAALLASDIG